MEYTEEDIQQFINACDTMINSKFILVDKRIGDILSAIAVTKPVYNLIKQAMFNYNFVNEWKSATVKNGTLLISEEATKIIPFVFCVLKNIDDGKYNINDILIKYFSNDENKRSSYVVFCQKLIVPFKKAVVNKICGKKVVVAGPKTAPATPFTSDVLNRLEFLVKDVKSFVVGGKRVKGVLLSKTRIIDVIDAYILAINKKDEAYFNIFTNVLLDCCLKNKELANRIGAIELLLKQVKEN